MGAVKESFAKTTIREDFPRNFVDGLRLEDPNRRFYLLEWDGHKIPGAAKIGHAKIFAMNGGLISSGGGAPIGNYIRLVLTQGDKGGVQCVIASVHKDAGELSISAKDSRITPIEASVARDLMQLNSPMRNIGLRQYLP